jgi:hypothetical protein
MSNVVLLESVQDNFVVNFPGTQFQAQHASIIFINNISLLGHFWTNFLKRTVYLLMETRRARYRSSVNPHLIHETPLHVVSLCVNAK